MVKKVKGMKVQSPQLQETHKFTKEGNSQLGTDSSSSHALAGTTNTSGDVTLDGEMTLSDRISGYLFSPPHIDGADTNQINELMNNISEYEGFMVYLLSTSSVEPFVNAQKFYFCENGEWHPSPFSHSGSTNYDLNPQPANTAPYVNPAYEISVPSIGTEQEPFVLDLPSDLFLDDEGHSMTYTAELVDGSPLPSWLSFDDTGTILSGTPTTADIGFYSILITATDVLGLTAAYTQQIEIIVAPPPTYSDPHVPFWNIPGVYQVGSDSDLTLDGQTTGVYHTAEATDATFNIMEHIPYGDTSTALVFEWAFDGSDTAGEGVRDAYTRIGFRSADQAGTNVRHYTMLPTESGRSTRGEKTEPGTTTITTAWMSMNDNPADWTFRAILKVDVWFTDGSEKPRMVTWAIAGKKNSANIPWSNFINSTSDYGSIEAHDGFLRWATFKYYGTKSSAGPTALNFYPFVQVRPETNNNTAEFHLTNPKVFFVDLDE